jgi:hypothetical protein
MNLANQKILVTGADGFIGSHLTEELIRHGANVRDFVFYNSFNGWGWLDTFPKDTLDKLDVFAGGYPRSQWGEKGHVSEFLLLQGGCQEGDGVTRIEQSASLTGGHFPRCENFVYSFIYPIIS